MLRIVAPADVDLLVGTSAADTSTSVRVRLIVPTRVVDHDRRLHTPVQVTPLEAGSARG